MRRLFVVINRLKATFMRLFNLVIVDSTVYHPNSREVIKLWIKKEIHQKFLFLGDMYDAFPATAISFSPYYWPSYKYLLHEYKN